MNTKRRQFSYERLAALLKERGWSHDRFTKEVYVRTNVSISAGALGSWKRGACPSVDTFEAVRVTLRVSKDRLTEPVAA